MSAEDIKIECKRREITYKTKQLVKLALLEWVCTHYGFQLPRMWLTKDLLKIKFSEETESIQCLKKAWEHAFSRLVNAAAAPLRRELGSGLALACALAERMTPYDASRVRPASAMPESPFRAERRASLGVGGASTTAAGNGGDASDSPPRQRRRERDPEDVQRSAQKTAALSQKTAALSESEVRVAALERQAAIDAAVLVDLRAQLALLHPGG